MCTVTYLPKPKGFILTHNRDEAPSRSLQSIVREKTAKGQAMLFPRDAMAGGTWIATSERGWTACLLNGAFMLHTRQLPYRRSRGLILLDFFDWADPDDFFQTYDLEQIEPFTMLFFQRSDSLELSERSIKRVTEFRWDGQQRHLKNLSVDQAHFWCSATLYPTAMQARREQVFRTWLATNPHFNKSTHQQILHLHRTGSVGDPENDFVMNRAGRVQTVSITQVIADEKNARMLYLDLLGGKKSERRLRHSKRQAEVVNR